MSSTTNYNSHGISTGETKQTPAPIPDPRKFSAKEITKTQSQTQQSNSQQTQETEPIADTTINAAVGKTVTEPTSTSKPQSQQTKTQTEIKQFTPNSRIGFLGHKTGGNVFMPLSLNITNVESKSNDKDTKALRLMGPIGYLSAQERMFKSDVKSLLLNDLNSLSSSSGGEYNTKSNYRESGIPGLDSDSSDHQKIGLGGGVGGQVGVDKKISSKYNQYYYNSQTGPGINKNDNVQNEQKVQELERVKQNLNLNLQNTNNNVDLSVKGQNALLRLKRQNEAKLENKRIEQQNFSRIQSQLKTEPIQKQLEQTVINPFRWQNQLTPVQQKDVEGYVKIHNSTFTEKFNKNLEYQTDTTSNSKTQSQNLKESTTVYAPTYPSYVGIDVTFLKGLNVNPTYEGVYQQSQKKFKSSLKKDDDSKSPDPRQTMQYGLSQQLQPRAVTVVQQSSQELNDWQARISSDSDSDSTKQVKSEWGINIPKVKSDRDRFLGVQGVMSNKQQLGLTAPIGIPLPKINSNTSISSLIDSPREQPKTQQGNLNKQQQLLKIGQRIGFGGNHSNSSSSNSISSLNYNSSNNYSDIWQRPLNSTNSGASLRIDSSGISSGVTTENENIIESNRSTTNKKSSIMDMKKKEVQTVISTVVPNKQPQQVDPNDPESFFNELESYCQLNPDFQPSLMVGYGTLNKMPLKIEKSPRFFPLPNTVYLNLYHVTLQSTSQGSNKIGSNQTNNLGTIFAGGISLGFQAVNNLFKNQAQAAAPIGIYHTGIEIYGREWAYGHNRNGTKDKDSDGNSNLNLNTTTGIYCCRPRCNRDHKYSETICLGDTELTSTGVLDLIKAMQPKWLGEQYSIGEGRCCVDFAREFSYALVNTNEQALTDKGSKTNSMPIPSLDWVSNITDVHIPRMASSESGGNKEESDKVTVAQKDNSDSVPGTEV